MPEGDLPPEDERQMEFDRYMIVYSDSAGCQGEGLRRQLCAAETAWLRYP